MNRWNLVTISTEISKQKSKTKKFQPEYTIRDVSTLPKAYPTDEEYDTQILKKQSNNNKQESITKASSITPEHYLLNEFLDFGMDDAAANLEMKERHQQLETQEKMEQSKWQKEITISIFKGYH